MNQWALPPGTFVDPQPYVSDNILLPCFSLTSNFSYYVPPNINISITICFRNEPAIINNLSNYFTTNFTKFTTVTSHVEVRGLLFYEIHAFKKLSLDRNTSVLKYILYFQKINIVQLKIFLFPLFKE